MCRSSRLLVGLFLYAATFVSPPSFAHSYVLLDGQVAHRAQAVSSNVPPSLTQPLDMSVTEGSVAEQTLSATDEDGQDLQFFKLEGPEFLSVMTLLTGGGSAAGLIRIRPGFIDAGGSRGRVGVSDGIDGTTRAFAVSVADADRSPSSSWSLLDLSTVATPEDPGHTVMADLNGDGVEDLVVGHVNTGAVSVYLGGGGAAFQLKATYQPLLRGLTSISIGDFTGDSRPDLVVT